MPSLRKFLNFSPKWKKDIRSRDEFPDDHKSTDLVVIVMGATGAGKSTFINCLLNEEVAPVGHNPDSCTEDVKAYHLPDSHFPDKRIILVDTPGFDDSKVPQSEIMRRISVWLARSYEADMKIAGVIFCHDILDPRWSGSTQANFDLFINLCGPAAARKTAIVTTRWDVPKDIAPLEAQEEELKNSYWKKPISAGTLVLRSSGVREDDLHIIDHLLARNAYYDPLQIQKELVDANKSMSSTTAGRELFGELEKKLNTYQVLAKILREEGGSQNKISGVEVEIEELMVQLKRQSASIPRMLKLFAHSKLD